MKNTRLFIIAMAAAAAGFAPSGAALADEQRGEPAVVLELFTSQGCYSCPPADDLLREAYVDRPDVIALEFHVDYWDDLVYGFAGSWKDPFSSSDYTRRQRDYNRSIRDTNTMYTPQVVIQGRSEAVGTRRDKIDERIAAELAQPGAVELLFSGEAGDWDVSVKGPLQGSEELVYAIYLRERVTEVKAGENKNKTMRNSHIVTRLGRGANRRYANIPEHDATDAGCAAWLQQPQTGAIIAAARCPGS